jgi:hypothetical protein
MRMSDSQLSASKGLAVGAYVDDGPPIVARRDVLSKTPANDCMNEHTLGAVKPTMMYSL